MQGSIFAGLDLSDDDEGMLLPEGELSIRRAAEALASSGDKLREQEHRQVLLRRHLTGATQACLDQGLRTVEMQVMDEPQRCFSIGLSTIVPHNI